MAAKLERQLHIAVTKQGLYSFWIGSHADQKRSRLWRRLWKPNRRGSSSTSRPCSSRCDERIPAFTEPAADNPRPACWRRAAVCPLDDPMGRHPVAQSRIGRLLFPAQHKFRQQRMERHRSFRSFALRQTYLTTRPTLAIFSRTSGISARFLNRTRRPRSFFLPRREVTQRNFGNPIL